MATGRKELSLFKRMTMEARIKFSHFFHKFGPFFQNIFRKTLTTSIFKSLSDFYHNFGMFLFDNKKWLKKWKEIIQRFSSYGPTINRSIKCFFGSPSVSALRTTAKMFLKPIDNYLIARSNSNIAMPLMACAVFALFDVSDVETTFSINKTSQISEFHWNLSFFEKSFTGHKKSPLVNDRSIINENNNNIQRDRLNKETHQGMRQSELVSRVREENPKSFSRLEIGHKSNRMVLNEAAARLGQSMRETEDELCRDMLAGTASVINCTNGVNGDNPTEITRADVDNVVATLQNNDADFMTNMIGGEDKFGTGPVRDAYFGLCDTRMIGQLEGANGFINKAQYPNQTGVMSSEWGSIGNARFYLSSRGSVTVGASLLGADIYNVFIGGQEAYAKVEQNGVSAKFIYHPPGHGDDPSELRQTAAWRMAQVPRITNDAWIISLRCTLA